ncbi:MAG: hypothetical protein M1826_006907 [Phylliscum demangeonii]|nr:MAG: hypothetical protein M1826_006907 [Phylliscum demangeonii]
MTETSVDLLKPGRNRSPSVLADPENFCSSPSKISPKSSSPLRVESSQKSNEEATGSDYQRVFPPFFVKRQVSLARTNGFVSVHDLQLVRQHMDHALQQRNAPGNEDAMAHSSFLTDLRTKRASNPDLSPYAPLPSAEDLVTQINTLYDQPFSHGDDSKLRGIQRALELLFQTPVKYFKHAEDYRPPYRGTVTRLSGTSLLPRLARNPVQRLVPDTRYEDDSGEEWEEVGEGEELASEGEEDCGSDGEPGEMEDFLDDADLDVTALNQGSKGRVVGDDLEPVCSGLCWENAQGKNAGKTVTNSKSGVEFGSFKMGLLLASGKTGQTGNKSTRALHPMDPPRLPLHAINRTNATTNQLALVDATGKVVNEGAGVLASANRIVGPELMEEFKSAVQGSDSTKIGLIEILKKRYAFKISALLVS